MTKVTTIDKKAFVNVIRPALDRKLAELSKELGISIKAGSGHYGTTTGDIKIEMATISEDGLVMTPERKAFLELYKHYNLPKEALDAEIELGGHKVRIAGIKIKARKNNVLLDCLDGSGRQMVAPDSTVKAVYMLQYQQQNAG